MTITIDGGIVRRVVLVTWLVLVTSVTAWFCWGMARHGVGVTVRCAAEGSSS